MSPRDARRLKFQENLSQKISGCPPERSASDCRSRMAAIQLGPNSQRPDHRFFSDVGLRMAWLQRPGSTPEAAKAVRRERARACLRFLSEQVAISVELELSISFNMRIPKINNN
jgi:hypothetical protein